MTDLEVLPQLYDAIISSTRRRARPLRPKPTPD